jgi:small GTP-binding protein
MRQSMLSDEQARFLREEKEALSEIRLALADVDLPREALATLQDAILQLDELFLIVVVGEFNAGKSALVNALLGEKVLLEGATPTTSRVTLVKWGEQVAEQVVDENFAIYTYPLPLLKELNIVDTPGTNAVIRHHERLTDEFVPRSDLVLFVTSADHPLTESERQFLERILAWGKKIVFALNKADIIEGEAGLEEVRSFVLKHATLILKGVGAAGTARPRPDRPRGAAAFVDSQRPGGFGKIRQFHPRRHDAPAAEVQQPAGRSRSPGLAGSECQPDAIGGSEGRSANCSLFGIHDRGLRT